MENLKETVRRWAWPFIVGAIVGMIGLATLGGFMSGGSADELVQDAVQDTEEAFAVVLVPLLSPVCAANARADPDKLAEVMAKSSYQQRQAISDTGWVTYPEGASSTLTRAIDQGCLDALTE